MQLHARRWATVMLQRWLLTWQETHPFSACAILTQPATQAPPQPKGRFDPNTGEENPKFDPETGVQNW